MIDSILVYQDTRGEQLTSFTLQERIFQDLNPDDIKDVEVIKGPAAIARGACENGLIIITTKRGSWRPPPDVVLPPRKECAVQRPR